MMDNYSICHITVLLLCGIIIFIFQVASVTSEVTFDYDCSQVECTTDSDSCPPDSIERQSAPAFDVLYGPEELMPPHDFYDEVEDLGDVVEQHFDELPMELSEVTALPVNSTVSQLTSGRDTKGLETEKGPELVLVKRQLQFDHGPSEDMDTHERMLQMCCPTITLESLRRRRRYASVEDCKCKACQPLPQCPSGEVAVRVHEAKGVPGDCCATYACAPKRECGDVDAQPYWRDACTRCSCHGENGPEFCHNECPMNEMGEIETERSCYATNSEEPMLHGSDWYENDWCTMCHCENGERECVGSLCLPTTCSNPVKVPGQCCPQCPVGVENILIAHENSTETNISSLADKDLQDETTNTTNLSTTTENSTTTASTVSSAVVTSTLSTMESSSESSTVHVALQNEKGSTEENTVVMHSSSISTDETVSSTDVTPSITASTTTTRSIDDIASEVYYGPMVYTSTEESNTSTQQTLDRTSENITESTLEPQADISSSTVSSSAESTSTVEPTSTSVSSNSETISTETSTIEASSSTENSTELSTTASTTIADDISTTVSAIYNETVSTTETSQETPIAISNTESTATTNFKSTVTTTTAMDTTSSTAAISRTTSSDTTTTSSTTTLLPVDTSSTHLYSPTTSSPHTSTVNPSTSTTFTTNSPYSSTAATQTISTVVYWYTFSTSAPSAPIPQPTIYQPSVRKFFTRPEVRYIGAAVIAAFTVISALAVWKFCMPTRSERLKNHYRTVPSSEATSLSHISSTSHSSMA